MRIPAGVCCDMGDAAMHRMAADDSKEDLLVYHTVHLVWLRALPGTPEEDMPADVSRAIRTPAVYRGRIGMALRAFGQGRIRGWGLFRMCKFIYTCEDTQGGSEPLTVTSASRASRMFKCVCAQRRPARR
jgi:hypothetical protein